MADSTAITRSPPPALSLGDAIALARARRAELTRADLEVRRAELATLRAQLERLHLTLGAQYSEEVQRQDLHGQPAACAAAPDACPRRVHAFQASADLMIPLWTGFRITSQIAAAKAARRATEAARRATSNDVALDVAQSYWAVKRVQLLKDVDAEILERTLRIEQIARQKVDNGIAPQVDFNRIHVLVLRQRAQLTNLEADARAALAQFAAALQSDQGFRLVDEPDAGVVAVPALAAVEAEALSTRAELASARALVDQSQHVASAARGAYWPQISLLAQARAQNDDPSRLPGDGRITVGVLAGLEATWTAFDTLTTWTAVRDADTLHDEAVADVARIRSQVLADVRESHGRLAQSVERLALARQTAAAQRDNVNLLRQRYQVGSALLVELLLAQADLLQVEEDLVDASISIALARARLDAAVGKL